jgi:membrane-associated phospholipid phosphatase
MKKKIKIVLHFKMIKKLYCYIFFVFAASFVHAQNFDINALKRINVERNKSLDGTMKFLSGTATPVSLGLPTGMVITGLITHDKNLRDKGYELALSAAGNFVFTRIVKLAVNRPRPYITYPFIDPYKKTFENYSFPSGHASTAFAAATTISIQYKKWYIVAPAYLWAAAVVYSRMHLGVHYPTDVMAGALFGAGASLVAHKIRKWYYQKKEKKSSTALF